MNKKFFFLTGLPRTGNTLLSSILNQNKDIITTNYSILAPLLHSIDKQREEITYKNFPLDESLDNVLKNTFNNFYENFDCKFIIDRGPWGTTPHLNLLKKVFDDIRIIVLRRPFLEVLASYVRVYKPKDIEKSVDEWFFDEHNIIKMNAYIYNNMREEKNIKFHIVEYDNLVKDTKNEISDIYNFLDIPKFEHHYSNLNQFSINNQKYNDTVYGENINYHTIKTDKIERENYHYRDVLSQSIIDKYKHIDKELYNIK